MKQYIILLLVLLSLTTSCSDWLDVRGENIERKDQFDNYKGFRDARPVAIWQWAAPDIYGERLTMTDIENLADLWYTSDSYKTQFPLNYYLSIHKYDNDDARASIKAMYAQLFTTISSANVLIKNIKDKGSNITDAQARNVIEGEVCAIRAYASWMCSVSSVNFRAEPQDGALPYPRPPASTRCHHTILTKIMWLSCRATSRPQRESAQRQRPDIQ